MEENMSMNEQITQAENMGTESPVQSKPEGTTDAGQKKSRAYLLKKKLIISYNLE